MTHDEQKERIEAFLEMLDQFDATIKDAAATLEGLDGRRIKEARVRLGFPDQVINCMLKYNGGALSWDEARHTIMRALLKDKARN